MDVREPSETTLSEGGDVRAPLREDDGSRSGCGCRFRWRCSRWPGAAVPSLGRRVGPVDRLARRRSRFDRPVRVRARFTGRGPLRSAAALLVTVGAAFSLLWLSEIVPPMLDGTVPDVVREARLRTNPVHVLDLALFLPAAILAGVLLLGRPAVGVRPRSGDPRGHDPALDRHRLADDGPRRTGRPELPRRRLGIGVLAAVELIVVVRFLRAVDARSELGDVLRANLKTT